MSDTHDPPFDKVFDDTLFADIVTDGSATTPVALDPNEVFGDAAHMSVGTRVEHDGQRPRFNGDTSELPAEVCWALQELVAAPHVSEKSRKHWSAVLQYEDVLRSRLSELGLVLEINHEYRYAFTRQADDQARTAALFCGQRPSASRLAPSLYTFIISI